MSREAFEAWVKSPPYEHDTSRFPMDEDKFAWPGQYRDITIELAWEAWQAASASHAEQIRKLREALKTIEAMEPDPLDMKYDAFVIKLAVSVARAALKEES